MYDVKWLVSCLQEDHHLDVCAAFLPAAVYSGYMSSGRVDDQLSRKSGLCVSMTRVSWAQIPESPFRENPSRQMWRIRSLNASLLPSGRVQWPLVPGGVTAITRGASKAPPPETEMFIVSSSFPAEAFIVWGGHTPYGFRPRLLLWSCRLWFCSELQLPLKLPSKEIWAEPKAFGSRLLVSHTFCLFGGQNKNKAAERPGKHLLRVPNFTSSQQLGRSVVFLCTKPNLLKLSETQTGFLMEDKHVSSVLQD